MITVEFRAVSTGDAWAAPSDGTFSIELHAVPRIDEWVHIPNVMTGRVSAVDWRIEQGRSKVRVTLIGEPD